jgi:hypothetical protein
VTDLPPRLDELLTAMLATDAADRPGSAANVARILGEIIAELLPDQASRQRAGPSSGSFGASATGTRLVTSIVALRMGSGEKRARILDELKSRGADPVAFGHDAIVAHLGARRSLGGEAARALELGRFLAEKGGQVGVATGRSQVELTRPVGEVVDRAAGLAHAAESSQVLADTTSTELARGRFEFQLRPDGAAVVGEPLGRKRAEGAGGAPLLGREAELAQIMSAFERCVDDATPVLVSVAGAPGIGKSRLGREAVARLAVQSEAPEIVVLRCEPFGRGHLLGMAADLLRGLLGIGRGSSLEAVREALDGRVAAQVGKALGARASELLARLIANQALPEGIDARGARDELWLALTDFVVSSVGKEASLFVLEDLQWADPESVSWLDHLLGRALGRPLCVLSLVRPEFFREPGPAPRFVGRDHVRIELRPFPGGRRAASPRPSSAPTPRTRCSIASPRGPADRPSSPRSSPGSRPSGRARIAPPPSKPRSR